VLEGLLGFSDKQIDIVVQNSMAFAPAERARFLVRLSAALRGCRIDDAAVERACAEVRQTFARPL